MHVLARLTLSIQTDSTELTPAELATAITDGLIEMYGRIDQEVGTDDGRQATCRVEVRYHGMTDETTKES